MTDTMRAFVNGAGYDVPAGGTAYDAVALHDADEARALREGGVVVTNSRGLPPTRKDEQFSLYSTRHYRPPATIAYCCNDST